MSNKPGLLDGLDMDYDDASNTELSMEVPLPNTLDEIADLVGKAGHLDFHQTEVGIQIPPWSLTIDLTRTIVLQLTTLATFLGIRLPNPELHLDQDIGVRWRFEKATVELVIFDMRVYAGDSYPHVHIEATVRDREGYEVLGLGLSFNATSMSFFDGAFNWLGRPTACEKDDSERRSSGRRDRMNDVRQYREDRSNVFDGNMTTADDRQNRPEPQVADSYSDPERDAFADFTPTPFFGAHIPDPHLSDLNAKEAGEALYRWHAEDWPEVSEHEIEWFKTAFHNLKGAARLIGIDLSGLIVTLPHMNGSKLCKESKKPAELRLQNCSGIGLDMQFAEELDRWIGWFNVCSRECKDDYGNYQGMTVRWNLEKTSGKTLAEDAKLLFESLLGRSA